MTAFWYPSLTNTTSQYAAKPAPTAAAPGPPSATAGETDTCCSTTISGDGGRNANGHTYHSNEPSSYADGRYGQNGPRSITPSSSTTGATSSSARRPVDCKSY